MHRSFLKLFLLIELFTCNCQFLIALLYVRLNLAVDALSTLPIVVRIEDMLGDLYSFFYKSPNKHLEFLKLAEVMETKRNEILRNIKTRWINMLAPLIWVMNKY